MTRTKPQHPRPKRPRRPAGATKPPKGRDKGPPEPAVFVRSEEERYARADDRYPFGPTFFRKQLRAFMRDEAAEPTDVLPVVEIHLVDRHPLDLAHIINVTPEWVALAVADRGEGGSARLRTEFVPYDAIARVTLLPVRTYASQLGFDRARLSQMMNPPPRPAMTPAAAVRSAAGEIEAPAVREGASDQEPPVSDEMARTAARPAASAEKPAPAHRTARRPVRLTRRPRPPTPDRP
jgi:hypothetical protein